MRDTWRKTIHVQYHVLNTPMEECLSTLGTHRVEQLVLAERKITEKDGEKEIFREGFRERTFELDLEN